MMNQNSLFPNLYKACGKKHQIDKQQQEELNNNARRMKQYTWELAQKGI
jgi:hypothetical protein